MKKSNINNQEYAGLNNQKAMIYRIWIHSKIHLLAPK